MFEYDIFEQMEPTPPGDMQKEKEVFVKKTTDVIREMFDQQGILFAEVSKKRQLYLHINHFCTHKMHGRG